MILLLKDLKKLLEENLTVSQRGLIITLALCKEKIPAFTEVKFKLFVEYKDHKEDLVYLHERGYIKWDKYKYYKKKLKESSLKNQEPVHEVIKFMNEMYGRRFDYKSKVTTNLKARLKEYSLDNIKLVVSNRYEKWKDDEVMKDNLNPITIFRSSLFPKYLEEAKRTGVGEGILSTSKIEINEGDEITLDISKDLVDGDLYSFKTFKLDSKGLKRGNGRLETKKGKDVKILLKIQNNLLKNGELREFIYIFVKR